MPEASLASDPGARNSVKKDNRFPRSKEVVNPIAPTGETSTGEDLHKTFPINRVESFVEI